MDGNLQFVFQKQLERTKLALEKNNMEAMILQNANEVVPTVRAMMHEGALVANGGSVTLAACGVMDLLRSGSYRFLDRDVPDVDRKQLFRDSFSADYYLSSANAVTQAGEIYQVDGNANRVAAIAHGPSTVILVVGRNKIVHDIPAALQRRADVAGPANCARLELKTPCATTGICSDCKSPARICCTEMILRYQREAGRIKVLLVNEDLGY